MSLKKLEKTVIIGIATANTSAIIFATAIASRLAAVGIAIVCTTTAIESGRHSLSDLCAGCCYLLRDARPDGPSIDSTPNAEPGSSFAFPSSSCGYQNRACYGTL